MCISTICVAKSMVQTRANSFKLFAVRDISSEPRFRLTMGMRGPMLNSDRRQQQKEFTGITKAPAGLAIDNLSATKLADLSVGRKSSRLEFLREINHKLSQPA